MSKTILIDGVPTEVTVVKEATRSPLEHAGSWVPGSDEVVYERVKQIIQDIEKGGEAKCLEYCQTLDKWPCDRQTVLLSPSEVETQISDEFVSQSVKADIQKQVDMVKAFAQQQKLHAQSFEKELTPGLITGQKIIPLNVAGCYVPGGRYSHVSSAVMTITTAKVAGVKTVVAASPPQQGSGKMQPATLFAMWYAGADHILCCGGTQAIASLTFGLFTGKPADVVVGPGNPYVAEAKRLLYGRIGIDMFAGPTEIMVLADESADASIVASDLISQAEHGPTSPAWLITTDLQLAEKVKELAPRFAMELPAGNIAVTSWADFGEIIVVQSREDMARLSDHYAAEHLEVQCKDQEWWLDTLTNYGSLFLGEEVCVTYGDKISGPNHVLPTLRAARYTGGLSVDKFVKKVTFQRASRSVNDFIGPLAARISRTEGMEGHARAADDRLRKYFPDQHFDLGHRA